MLKQAPPPAVNPKLSKYFGLFKDDDGETPLPLTPHQLHIMDIIIRRPYNRVQCIAYTQYGKSTACALGLIISAAILNEKWAIVAPTEDKAGIIMGAVIQHLFDSPLFYQQLLVDTPLEKLKQERSKKRLTFKGGGEIRVYSADVRNRKAVIRSLTGFGSKNVVIDESSLIPNDFHGMIRRMVRGKKDNFIFEIGNPFEKHHFYRTWIGGKYYRIYIDYLVGLMEGRISEADLEEAREDPFFDILYECVFPDESLLLEGGYRKLFTAAIMAKALIPPGSLKPAGTPRFGGDFAGSGKDLNAYVARWDNLMRLLETNNNPDTMAQVPTIINYLDELKAKHYHAGLDMGGLGQGAVDRLHERGYKVNGVMFGGSAPDTAKFKNVRAYMFWEFAEWLRKGGKIEEAEGWEQLGLINFKQDSSSKFFIEPKDKLRERGEKSPDVADAGALTFAPARPGTGIMAATQEAAEAATATQEPKPSTETETAEPTPEEGAPPDSV